MLWSLSARQHVEFLSLASSCVVDDHAAVLIRICDKGVQWKLREDVPRMVSKIAAREACQ